MAEERMTIKSMKIAFVIWAIAIVILCNAKTIWVHLLSALLLLIDIAWIAVSTKKGG